MMQGVGSPERVASPRKLRYAVMCEGYVFAEWQARCLEAMFDLPEVELSLLIVNERKKNQSLLTKLGQLRPKHLLFQLWTRGLMRSRAMETRDLAERLARVPMLACRTRFVGKYAEHFAPSDLAEIEAYDLDFILRFSFGIIRGEILQSARFGVWSFHHGDEQRYRGSAPGFWEIARGDPVTGAILQRLTERLDGGVVLKKGHFKTVRYSYRRNLDTILFGAAHWPAEVCRDLVEGCFSYLEESPVQTEAPVYRSPGTFRVVATWGMMLRQLVEEVFRYFFVEEEWAIGFIDCPLGETLSSIEAGAQPVGVREWVVRPDPRGYWADPFVVERNGQRHLLCEDFDYCKGQGKIVIVPLREASGSTTSIHELPIERHASYPCAFEHQGDVYCVPEVFESREIALFKAVEFPRTWERCTILIHDFAGVDPTLFRHRGLWWLVATDAERDPDRDLFAWYSENLFGKWRSHLRNPIKVDIRSARPAGPPLEHEGRLYRPAQDCSRTYGGAVVINRVSRLTPTEFLEDVVGFMPPDPEGPYPDGLHTLTGCSDLTVIDVKRHAFKPCTTWHRFRTIPSRIRQRSRAASYPAQVGWRPDPTPSRTVLR